MDVRTAQPDEIAKIRSLLAECALPTEDVDAAAIDFLVVAEHDRIVGVIGLQAFGDAGLLRSLAVCPAQRGAGLGAALATALEARARVRGITRLVLLTQTAEAFFAQRGYRVIARSDAPVAIQDSREFRALCPASATCMTLLLDRNPP